MEQQGETLQRAEVVTKSLSERVFDEPWDHSPAFVRHGVQVEVVHGDGPIFSQEVWERGTWLPVHPFYEKRIERAIKKATKIAGSLAVANS